MAHKDIILPRTIALNWRSGAGFQTARARTDNGKEKRNANWSSSLASATFNYNTLRSADAQVVDDYFQICQGMAHTLKVWDPRRNTATTAEGKFVAGQAVYRITRGAYTIDKPITKLAATTVITGGTVDILTGISPDGATAWAGTFYLCMRFDVDGLEVDGVDYDRSTGQPFVIYRDVPMQELLGE